LVPAAGFEFEDLPADADLEFAGFVADALLGREFFLGVLLDVATMASLFVFWSCLPAVFAYPLTSAG
jgi:hypothetical protein